MIKRFIKNINWIKCIYYIFVFITFRLMFGKLLIINNAYYLSMAILTILIAGVTYIFSPSFTRKSYWDDVVWSILYRGSYTFFSIYIVFSLIMFGVSFNKDIIHKESPLLEYSTFRLNTIDFEIEKKTFRILYASSQYKGENIREFENSHKVLLCLKQPVSGIYWLDNVEVLPK